MRTTGSCLSELWQNSPWSGHHFALVDLTEMLPVTIVLARCYRRRSKSSRAALSIKLFSASRPERLPSFFPHLMYPCTWQWHKNFGNKPTCWQGRHSWSEAYFLPAEYWSYTGIVLPWPKKTATTIMHKVRTLFLSRDIEKSSLITLRCAAWAMREVAASRATVPISWSCWLRDKNSVLILCIIVVAGFFLARVVFIFIRHVAHMLRVWYAHHPYGNFFFFGWRVSRLRMPRIQIKKHRWRKTILLACCFRLEYWQKVDSKSRHFVAAVGIDIKLEAAFAIDFELEHVPCPAAELLSVVRHGHCPALHHDHVPCVHKKMASRRDEHSGRTRTWRRSKTRCENRSSLLFSTNVLVYNLGSIDLGKCVLVARCWGEVCAVGRVIWW